MIFKILYILFICLSFSKSFASSDSKLIKDLLSPKIKLEQLNLGSSIKNTSLENSFFYEITIPHINLNNINKNNITYNIVISEKGKISDNNLYFSFNYNSLSITDLDLGKNIYIPLKHRSNNSNTDSLGLEIKFDSIPSINIVNQKIVIKGKIFCNSLNLNNFSDKRIPKRSLTGVYSNLITLSIFSQIF